MPFEAVAVTVLIASPGDTAEARDAVETAVASWNRDRSRSQKIVLLPLRWETDAVPSIGADAQSVINEQLVDTADIVVALFHSRLGVPTPRSSSGTAEEIERAQSRGAPVHVYFSEMPIPRNVDPDELKRLNEFRSHIRDQGLLGSYVSLEDLTAKVRTALEHDLQSIIDARQALVEREDDQSGDPERSASERARAVMRARFLHEGASRDVLIIENLGSWPAEQVSIEVEPIGEGEPPSVFLDEPIERLPTNASIRILVAVSFGTAAQWRVTIRWSEGERKFEESQSITTF